jgi:hypothetical protein
LLTWENSVPVIDATIVGTQPGAQFVLADGGIQPARINATTTTLPDGTVCALQRKVSRSQEKNEHSLPKL